MYFKFDQSKSRVNAIIEIPKTDPEMQTSITGFLPYLSLKIPISGAAMNWAKEYVPAIYV